jgi:hypothetical protein
MQISGRIRLQSAGTERLMSSSWCWSGGRGASHYAGDAVPTILPPTCGTETRFQDHRALSELAAYVAPEQLALPLTEITPLHLSREWNRLLKSGGHHRKTKGSPSKRQNRKAHCRSGLQRLRTPFRLAPIC